MRRRLRDLDPKMAGGFLRFDCPLGHDHCIRVPLVGREWSAEGEYPDALTVTPSIHALGDCGWHGFVTNGEVR